MSDTSKRGLGGYAPEAGDDGDDESVDAIGRLEKKLDEHSNSGDGDDDQRGLRKAHLHLGEIDRLLFGDSEIPPEDIDRLKLKTLEVMLDDRLQEVRSRLTELLVEPPSEQNIRGFE